MWRSYGFHCLLGVLVGSLCTEYGNAMFATSPPCSGLTSYNCVILTYVFEVSAALGCKNQICILYFMAHPMPCQVFQHWSFFEHFKNSTLDTLHAIIFSMRSTIIHTSKFAATSVVILVNTIQQSSLATCLNKCVRLLPSFLLSIQWSH